MVRTIQVIKISTFFFPFKVLRAHLTRVNTVGIFLKHVVVFYTIKGKELILKSHLDF